MPLKWRWVLIVFLTVLSCVLAYPPSQKIKLGLDLKGGIHLVMRVKTDDAVKAATDLDLELLRSELQKKGVVPQRIDSVGVDRIDIHGVDSTKATDLREVVSSQFSAWSLPPLRRAPSGRRSRRFAAGSTSLGSRNRSFRRWASPDRGKSASWCSCPAYRTRNA